jgi:hypothetical protein
MTLEFAACVYFAGALITSIGVRNMTYFYRCVLLWPFFWAYIAMLVLEAAYEDFRP